MEIELQEIRGFLAGHAPFNLLPDELLDELPEHLSIRYLRRGSPFPPSSDEDSLYIVRSGAIELRDAQGRLHEKLGEGDIHAAGCQLLDLAGDLTGEATEDTLLYLIPCRQVKRLMGSSEPFDRHFSTSLKERLKYALHTIQAPGQGEAAWLATEVGTLLQRPPVTLECDASIREAARLMTREGVSSVLLLDDGRLAGMVTDSDLRRRCVAEGLAVEGPVREIMTANPITVQRDTLLIEALMTMARLRVHHLPVLEGERLAGMLSSSDIARQQSNHPVYMTGDIRKAKGVEELTTISQRLPALQLQLAAASATAHHIGEAISCVTDSLTARLLEMAEERLGPPPVPYVWMAGGSQARREQTSHSDQDNALILADDYSEESHGEYFKELARFVSDGLDACGFIYCPGNAMATNPEWRQPLATWRRYFHTWIERPEPKALMLSSIFFDLRPIHGDESLFRELQPEVLAMSRRNRIFIAHMVANALTHRPPLGFFRTFVLIRDGEHHDTLDIKHRGIVPITDLARVYALAEGLEAVNTTERLRAAAQCGALSEEMAENLEDALEFIASLRIRHQAEQLRNGLKPDNYLPPGELSELERDHLKDAFRVIQTMQEAMAHRHHAGSLG